MSTFVYFCIPFTLGRMGFVENQRLKCHGSVTTVYKKAHEVDKRYTQRRWTRSVVIARRVATKQSRQVHEASGISGSPRSARDDEGGLFRCRELVNGCALVPSNAAPGARGLFFLFSSLTVALSASLGAGGHLPLPAIEMAGFESPRRAVDPGRAALRRRSSRHPLAARCR